MSHFLSEDERLERMIDAFYLRLGRDWTYADIGKLWGQGAEAAHRAYHQAWEQQIKWLEWEEFDSEIDLFFS